MLIQEIFTPGHEYPPSSLQKLEDGPDVGDLIGSGSFAKVYEDKTNQYNVIKIGRVENEDPKKDGYLAFLNNIKRLKIITFPRVDTIEIFKNVDEGYIPYIFKVRMEKLIPGTELSSSEIISLFERFLGKNSPAEELEIHQETDIINKIEIFLGYLKRYMFTDGFADELKQIPDRNLRLAVRSMKKTMKEFKLDLHGYNVMFRRTPYGVQPVFTDPFAWLK